MGVLTDVFIASPDQITGEVLARGPIGRLQSLEGKGLFPDSVLELWQIIDPTKEEPHRRDMLEIVCKDDDHAIFSIPNSLVSAMAGAGDDRVHEVEVAWLYRGTPPPPDPLDGIIKDWYEEFVDLLKEGQRRGLNVYVWVCA